MLSVKYLKSARKKVPIINLLQKTYIMFLLFFNNFKISFYQQKGHSIKLLSIKGNYLTPNSSSLQFKELKKISFFHRDLHRSKRDKFVLKCFAGGEPG